VKCHGADGRGTAARAKLPKIPDFTRPEWHKQRSDTELTTSILEGKETDMPAFGGKLSEQAVRDLLAYVRAFGGRAQAARPSQDDSERQFRQLQEKSRRLRQQFEEAQKQPRERPESPAPATQQPPTRPSEAVRTPSRVFRQRCLRCHGADGKGSRARDKFPEIPDFTEVRWQRGHSDQQLLASILNGKGAEMPSFRDKISEDQARELVAQVWRFSVAQREQRTAPPRQPDEKTPSGAEQSEELAPAEDDAQSGPERSASPKLIAWLGRFHPPAVHFPIGLLLGAALAEALLLPTGRSLFEAASRVCIWFGALTAVVAATLGWFLAGARLSDPNWIMTTHRWLGTSTLVCAWVVLLLSELSRRSDHSGLRIGFRLVLLLNALLLLATGFFGGALVHPLTYYAWPS
jgi:mono/diheme cytochrome c family protein/uncharacterized membrane protein